MRLVLEATFLVLRCGEPAMDATTLILRALWTLTTVTAVARCHVISLLRQLGGKSPD